MKYWIYIASLFCFSNAWAQTLNGTVLTPEKTPLPGAKSQFSVQRVNFNTSVMMKENFQPRQKLGDTIQLSYFSFDTLKQVLNSKDFESTITFIFKYDYLDIEGAVVERKLLESFDVGILPPIRGVQITTGTNAVISLEKLNGAKSSGNPRELYARIPGLNIWESDGAGIQLGIGGRGLSPKRAANFNTRQNGYDISADALGYPESYYTPGNRSPFSHRNCSWISQFAIWDAIRRITQLYYSGGSQKHLWNLLQEQLLEIMATRVTSIELPELPVDFHIKYIISSKQVQDIEKQ